MKAILELDMPEKCIECELSINQRPSIFIWCKITTEECENPYKCRNINCPLKIKDI
jgi:hypothetical protein